MIVAIFFATSSDSASLVVDMLCTGHADPGPTRQRVFWGVSEGAVAVGLIVLAGETGLEALQQVVAVVGLPIFLMVFAMLFALLWGLRQDDPLKRPIPGGVPPALGPSAQEDEEPTVVGTATR